MFKSFRTRLLVAVVFAPLLLAQRPAASEVHWRVKPQWVKADEDFLASDALQGRGSATRDEEIAATYVGSRFEFYGLKPEAEGGQFVQPVELESPKLDGKAELKIGDAQLDQGSDFRLMLSSGESVNGPLQKIAVADAQGAKVTSGAAVLLSGDDGKGGSLRAAMGLARGGAKLVLLEDSPAIEAMMQRMGGKTRVPMRVQGAGSGALLGGLGQSSIVAVKAPALTKLAAAQEGAPVSLTVHATPEIGHTYNAMGMLPGTDPASGTILLTAHLDHLGIGTPVNGDAIYNGANDDAAGTTAVLELAHALSQGPRLKRNVLFVCFGSEEKGGMGADYFREHPPLPLKEIAANLEFEMIGTQDPKMPKGTLLLTGWERSNLGPTLAAHGAKLGPDPYPEQHFFQRSDNYALALKGVVAQTAAGWGTPPTYHQPDDDLEHLNIPFMTAAIQSLIEPVRWLANSNFKPRWNPGGQPKP